MQARVDIVLLAILHLFTMFEEAGKLDYAVPFDASTKIREWPWPAHGSTGFSKYLHQRKVWKSLEFS